MASTPDGPKQEVAGPLKLRDPGSTTCTQPLPGFGKDHQDLCDQPARYWLDLGDEARQWGLGNEGIDYFCRDCYREWCQISIHLDQKAEFLRRHGYPPGGLSEILVGLGKWSSKVDNVRERGYPAELETAFSRSREKYVEYFQAWLRNSFPADTPPATVRQNARLALAFAARIASRRTPENDFQTWFRRGAQEAQSLLDQSED